jgi:sugar/nucleoside kinase (ribokinase family)
VARARRHEPRLACLGDLTLDIVVRAESGVATGTDVPGVVQFRVGGSAANTARAFAALGGSASVIGAVGKDELGARLVAAMRNERVTVHALRSPGLSARLLALISADGERSFVTDRGVADSLTAVAVKPAWVSRADALHVPAYSLLTPPLADAALDAIARARAAGTRISVDLASRLPLLARGRRAARDLIRMSAPDILFANASEVAAVVGSTEPARVAALAPVVVIKLGAGGCRVIWSGERQGEVLQSVVATRLIAAEDTTGAGDAFDAGFLYSLIGSGYRPRSGPAAAVLRRAALAGHRSAARLLTGPRKELFT